MAHTSQLRGQDRRNALMERILMRKFDALQDEYSRMKHAEERLKKKQELQAIKDRNNPNFDPNAEIHYNPNTNDNASSDEECGHDDFEVNWDDFDAEAEEDKIHLSDDGIDKIKSLMMDMPSLNNVPKWADSVDENVWKTKLLESLEHKSDGIKNETKVIENTQSTKDNDAEMENRKEEKDETDVVTTTTRDTKQLIDSEQCDDTSNKSPSKSRSSNDKKDTQSKSKGKQKNKNRQNKHRAKGKSKGKGNKHKSKRSRK